MDVIAIDSEQSEVSLVSDIHFSTKIIFGVEVYCFGSVFILHLTGGEVDGDLKLVDKPSEDAVPDSLPDSFLLHDSGLSSTF